MTKERKRPRTSGTRDFLDTPMYRLVDRHRAILEKIRTREDAEYWGHMLIGEYYPEIPNSRGASWKLAALVGLTDYMDFYCTWGYYDLLKEGRDPRGGPDGTRRAHGQGNRGDHSGPRPKSSACGTVSLGFA